jgi:lipid-A-disaccharide synthase
MKVYIIAGEASGDLHAANLVKALRYQTDTPSVRAWGGDALQAAGAELVRHYRDLAFMGFVEVLAHLRTILRNIRYCKEDIRAWRPDVLILVDYPGFNLRIAPYAKALGIPVVYYISPQVWAWKESRVRQIRRNVDRMLVILPFEKAFYAKHGYEVEFVGHPLLDVLDNLEPDAELHARLPEPERLVALIPGSRKQEIRKMLPVMLDAAARHPQYRYAIAGAPGIDPAFYQPLLPENCPVPVLTGKTRMLMKHASAALVTSGTATLETALSGTPQVVCYRGGRLSYLIARQLVRVSYIGLVNLVMEREVAPELIQSDMTADRLAYYLPQLMEPGAFRNDMLESYEALRRKLGKEGASQRAAASVVSLLREKQQA